MYVDAVIQGKHKSQERQAFTTMIDRFEGGENSLITADRGYESYDVFAHLIEKNLKFVVRIKDINSKPKCSEGGFKNGSTFLFNSVWI